MMHEVGLCAVPLVGYVMGKGALVQLQVRAGSADNALGVQEVTVLPSLHTNSDSEEEPLKFKSFALFTALLGKRRRRSVCVLHVL